MKSFDEHGIESRILSSKGVMGEALKLNEHVTGGNGSDPKKFKYLYRSFDTEDKVFIKNALINPISPGPENKPVAALEVVFKKDILGPDDYYSVLAITLFCQKLLANCFSVEVSKSSSM